MEKFQLCVCADANIWISHLNRLPFVNGCFWTWPKNIEVAQIIWNWHVQQCHIEIISAQLAIDIFIELIQFFAIVDLTIGTLFDANFQCLAPFFDIQEKYIRFIDRI